MKNIIILILALVFSFTVSGQKKEYMYHATNILKSDGTLVLKGDTVKVGIGISENGQFLRRVSGNWVGVELTGTGTDSLVFDPIEGELYDYRGGSVYDIIPIKYDNIFLEPGGTRTISVSLADGGQPGDDLLVKAGDNDDNQGGGDLYLRGGGTIDEHGNMYLGSVEYNSLIYVEDTVKMQGNHIKGLPVATEATEPVILSQITGLTKTVYSIALPNATTVTGRVNGATAGVDYDATWTLAAGTNTIDLQVTHDMGRRVANVNVCTANGTAEQLLRPFAGAYSGWQTLNDNTLLINSLATTPLALKIYIIFE